MTSILGKVRQITVGVIAVSALTWAISGLYGAGFEENRKTPDVSPQQTATPTPGVPVPQIDGNGTITAPKPYAPRLNSLGSIPQRIIDGNWGRRNPIPRIDYCSLRHSATISFEKKSSISTTSWATVISNRKRPSSCLTPDNPPLSRELGAARRECNMIFGFH